MKLTKRGTSWLKFFACACHVHGLFHPRAPAITSFVSNLRPNTPNTEPSVFWKAKTFPSTYCWIVSCQIFELGLNASPLSLEIIWLKWTSPARKLVSSLLSRLCGSCAPFRNRWLRWTQQESSCLSDLRKCLPSSVQVKKKNGNFSLGSNWTGLKTCLFANNSVTEEILIWSKQLLPHYRHFAC